jgi:hypothetical protein
MSELDNSVVSIRFIGENLDSKLISEQLGYVESTLTETRIKKLKNGIIVWRIRLAGKEKIPLETKVMMLLGEFSKDINAWKQITERIKADIFCGLFLEDWNQGFGLTPTLMKEISDRNLEIGFDIYSPPDPE